MNCLVYTKQLKEGYYMDQKEKIIEHYFQLSDIASKNDNALNQIINLFANNAIVKGANGIISNNHEAIVKFFKDFFKDNKELHHICHVFIKGNKYEAEWAVAGRKMSGKIFALHGFDIYKFNDQNKITFLQVKTAK